MAFFLLGDDGEGESLSRVKENPNKSTDVEDSLASVEQHFASNGKQIPQVDVPTDSWTRVLVHMEKAHRRGRVQEKAVDLLLRLVMKVRSVDCGFVDPMVQKYGLMLMEDAEEIENGANSEKFDAGRDSSGGLPRGLPATTYMEIRAREGKVKEEEIDVLLQLIMQARAVDSEKVDEVLEKHGLRIVGEDGGGVEEADSSNVEVAMNGMALYGESVS